MDVSAAAIDLQGTAFNMSAVANFIDNLDKVEEFAEPILIDASQQTAGGSKTEIYDFRINFGYSFQKAKAPTLTTTTAGRRHGGTGGGRHRGGKGRASGRPRAGSGVTAMAMQTGLEGKPWYYGVVIGALVAGAIIAAGWYFLVEPKNKEIEEQERKLAGLQVKIQEGGRRNRSCRSSARRCGGSSSSSTSCCASCRRGATPRAPAADPPADRAGQFRPAALHSRQLHRQGFLQRVADQHPLERHVPQPGALLRPRRPVLAHHQRREPPGLGDSQQHQGSLDRRLVHRQDVRLSRDAASGSGSRAGEMTMRTDRLLELRRSPRLLALLLLFAAALTVPAGALAQAPAPANESPAATEASGAPAQTTSVDEILASEEDVLAGTVYSYDPGTRRDPFRSLLAAKNRVERKGPLPEGIPGLLIDELDLTGIFRTSAGFVAQVLASNKEKSYLIREGDELYDGDVVSISQNEVVFKQIVNDPTVIKPFREVVKKLSP
jgi:hypothetical protein